MKPCVLRAFSALAVLLTAGGMTSCGAEAWRTTPIAQFETVQGLLQIDQVGTYGHRLSVAGQFITELEAGGVSIASSVTSADTHQYVLLNISKGGGSCPQRYRLLDLSPGRKPYITQEFGNCTYDPVLRLQDPDVMIEFSTAADFQAESFSYDPAHRSLQALRTPH